MAFCRVQWLPNNFCREVQKGDGVLKLLRNRNFSLLWWGGLVSMLGNWMLIVALPVYIYQETGSTLATSLMFIAGTVPRVLLGSAAGVFVDQLEHKRTMIICNLLLAATVVPLFLVTSIGALWLIYAVAFLQSAISLFFGPAENAFLPSLVNQDSLIPANALNALNNNLARLVGPAIGGLIVSYFGLAGVVVFDVASYLVAAALITLVAAPTKATREQDAPTQAASAWPSQFVLQWREGLAQIRRNRVMTVVLYAMTLAAFGEGAFSVLFAPSIHEAFSGGTLEFGWVMSASAVGGVAGGVLIGSMGHLKPTRVFAFGLLYLGLIDLVMFNCAPFVSSIVPIVVLMVIVGIPATAIGAGYTTLMQTSVEDRFLGRVFSTVDAVSSLTLLVGMAAAGFLGDLVGVMTLVKVQGLAHTLAGLLVLALLRLRPPQSEVDSSSMSIASRVSSEADA